MLSVETASQENLIPISKGATSLRRPLLDPQSADAGALAQIQIVEDYGSVEIVFIIFS